MKNKFYICLIMLSLSSNVYSQIINIHSITVSRQASGDNGYTLDGVRMAQGARQKLVNKSNFGTNGTYPKGISIVDGYGKTGSLTQISGISTENIFFFGSFNRLHTSIKQFTNAEIDSLYNWSKRGGKLIIASGIKIGTSFDATMLNSKWGYAWIQNSPNLFIPTLIGNSTDIFNGPFGNVIAANQGAGAQGYFNSIPSNSKVLATDPNGNPTLFMDCNTLDLIIADVDGYTDLGGISAGKSINNNQDRFWVNTIVFMDKLQPLPVISYNSDTLSLNSTYVNYQWFHDGNLVSNDSIYKITNCGTYYAEVTLNGGCKTLSNSIIVNSVSSAISETVCDSYTVPSGDETYTTSGTYLDTLTSANGCDSLVTINLTVNHSSYSTINETVCDSYTVPSGDETYTTSGTYLDTLTSANGCDSLVTINLTVNHSSYSTISESVSVDSSYVSPSGKFLWNTPGTYTDTLMGGNNMGCDSIITVNLSFYEEMALEMPNIFTPNQDGTNDYFKPIKISGVQQATITIYNRWGKKQFESNNITTGWDGKLNGKDCSEGVYYWIVQYTDIKGFENRINGYTTLIR